MRVCLGVAPCTDLCVLGWEFVSGVWATVCMNTPLNCVSFSTEQYCVSVACGGACPWATQYVCLPRLPAVRIFLNWQGRQPTELRGAICGALSVCLWEGR